MSEREQHMDTDKRTGTSGQCGNTDEMRWDLGTLFPAKGDPRRPPEWLGRALLYIAIAIVLLSFCWRSWGKIEYLIIDVVISLFLALAVEPVVIPLVKHGWKRSFASIFALLMLGVLLCVMFGLFGNLFVQQVIALCNGLPALYQQICDFVAQYTDFKLPEINSLGGEILKNIQTSWVTDFAGTAISTVSGFFSFLLNLMTVIMTTFYISAAGPKLRRAACQWMAPSAQRRFLFVWTVSQTQISSFLFSRAILAVLNAFFTSICLMALHVPYWMPLALFCGVVSQFIPMLGTYIGGALPVLFAWGSNGLWYGVGVRGGVHLRLPADRKPDLRAEDLPPHHGRQRCGRLPCRPGLRLAVRRDRRVPGAAYRRLDPDDRPHLHQAVRSGRFAADGRSKKSKLVEGAEVISEHLHAVPRAVQGSSAHVPIPDDVRFLQEQAYNITRSDETGDADESQTVAIPKHVLDGVDRKPLRGTAEADGAQTEAGPQVADGSQSQGTDDNPRSRWR